MFGNSCEQCLALISMIVTVYGATLPTGLFCMEGAFPCYTDVGYSCRPNSRKCDGIENCLHGDDERDCADVCYGNEFRCKSAGGYRCINNYFVCDGTPDCTDGTDEFGCIDSNCLKGEFSCITENGLTCQPIRYQCDGEKDCLDNSDESNCPGKHGNRN